MPTAYCSTRICKAWGYSLRAGSLNGSGAFIVSEKRWVMLTSASSTRSQTTKPSEDCERAAERRKPMHVGGCWLLVANIQSRQYPLNIYLIMWTLQTLNWTLCCIQKSLNVCTYARLVSQNKSCFSALSCRECISFLVQVRYSLSPACRCMFSNKATLWR